MRAPRTRMRPDYEGKKGKQFAASPGALRASENSLALDFFPERGTRQSAARNGGIDHHYALHSASLGALRASVNSLALNFFLNAGRDNKKEAAGPAPVIPARAECPEAASGSVDRSVPWFPDPGN